MTTMLSNIQNGNSVPTVENLFNSLFEDTIQRAFGDKFLHDGRVQAGKVPVNIRETEKEFQIDVIAPGRRKEDFKVEVEDKLLTVTLSAEQTATDEKVAWTRNEFVQESFRKTFTVDDSVDVNNIKASYLDGILHISLAKNQQAQSSARQIEIK